jgi:hypothetical protein
MVVNACKSSTKEAEAGSSGVQGQPGLCSETLCQTQNQQQFLALIFSDGQSPSFHSVDEGTEA